MVYEWSHCDLTVVSQWSQSGLSTPSWGGNGMTQQQTRQLQPLCPVCATSGGQASVALRGWS
eukprot:5511209-Prorocentrum_lima.AAC.1